MVWGKKECVEDFRKLVAWKHFKPNRNIKGFHKDYKMYFMGEGCMYLTIKGEINGEVQKSGVRVPLDYTDCNYGGQRIWWKCPNCYRRVGVLYLSHFHLRCRTCLNLTYRDRQAKGTRFFEAGRLFKKRRKLVDKIEKKGIHFKTLVILYRRVIQLDAILKIIMKDELIKMKQRYAFRWLNTKSY